VLVVGGELVGLVDDRCCGLSLLRLNAYFNMNFNYKFAANLQRAFLLTKWFIKSIIS
jgi:hypothetical protein